MAESAFQTLYRQEAIQSFEQRQSLLRDTVTTEAMMKGNQAVFLVAGSGGASATTRGVNGLIPARADNLTQNTCTLTEWHDLVRKTGFNIFASQSDQRSIMQQTTMGVINRKIDDDIITELNTGTVNTGVATNASVRLFNKASVILGNNEVPWDGNICLLCTPAFLAYLQEAPEFSSADYVTARPFQGDNPDWKDQMGIYRWRNVSIISHPNLPGIGSNAEKCFMFHKSAIGHAANTDKMDTAVGYEDEQDYSYCRASIFMGAKKLQDSGIVVINHDGSEFASS